jgi:protein-S-isoprenylcysteine O-methyltransferase Ste14
MKIGFDRNTGMIVKVRATSRVIFGIILMFIILFKSAGRWDYWHGWVYFLLWIYVELFTWLIVPSELLQERIKPGPGTKKWDYGFLAFFLPLTYLLPLIAALDGGRRHWTGDFPIWLNVLAFVVTLLGYSLMILSLWKNRFFSATVRIQKERGHSVVDKGPYAFIRHPGYAGLIVSSFGIAIGLNSLWALIPAGLYMIAFIIRTHLEDRTLRRELPGYAGYAARVKYRLIPRVW